MKLPRYTSTTTARGSGIARASDIGALTRTSDQAVYSGVGAFGRSLNVAADYAFKASQQRRAIDADLQYSQVSGKDAEFSESLSRSVSELPIRSDGHRMKIYNDLMEQVELSHKQHLNEIDSKVAQQALEADWSKAKLQYSKDIWGTLTGQYDNYQRKNGFDTIERLVKQGRAEEAESLGNELTMRGLYGEQEVDNFIKYQAVDTEARGMLAEGKDFEEVRAFIMKQPIDTNIKKKLVSDIGFEASQQQDRLEMAIQEDENNIFNLIASGQSAEAAINSSRVLDADSKWKWRQRQQAESARLAKGEDIVTDNAISSELYSGIFQVLTGAKTKQEVLGQAKKARMNGTLDQADYESFEKAINAQYEQAYTYQMGQVSRIAEGLLLNPDSLGYIKNAPIRYKSLGDFRKEWLQYIAKKGDAIKISDIYPEGMRLAAAHQISDEEAERLEVEMNEDLKEREEAKKISDSQARFKEANKKKEVPLGDRRVTVEKDGKQFTVPMKQLKEALKQGYTKVKK